MLVNSFTTTTTLLKEVHHVLVVVVVLGVSALLVAWMAAEALGFTTWLQYTLLGLFILLVAVPVFHAAWSVMKPLHLPVVLTAAESTKAADIIYKTSTRPVKALSPDDCAICLEPWQEGESLRELRCGHLYHEGCIKACIQGSLPLRSKHSSDLAQLVNSVSCPLCRQPMVAQPDEIARLIRSKKRSTQ